MTQSSVTEVVPTYTTPDTPIRPAETQRGNVASVSLKGLVSSARKNPIESVPDAGNKESAVVIPSDTLSEVTQDGLKKAWIRYARSIEEQNPRLYSLMYNQLPELRNGVEVWVKIKNQSQEVELQGSKSGIVAFLRTQLHHGMLNLFFEMESMEEESTKAYTSADKLKMMVEKNQALWTLKQQFGLDLD